MVTFDYKKTPITQIADYIIMYAAKSGASDIHFDPRENGLLVRIRIDGDLQNYTLVPKDYERNLTTRLKLLATMNITESRLPQDGAIKGKFGHLDLDMRVSCLPTNEGEKIVIRILDYSRSLQGLEHLGFSHENFLKLKRMIAVPNGIILVTGATGTGKSTTTYSILAALNKPETNIITVEDPIEMNMEGMNQVQVNSDIGLTFAEVLRSILRQDPNIILIGEIRDSETAKIAVRASITGHLVLSTIHTNNSLSTIERLLDMDVERYLLSTALTGIISQRLAKILCPSCRIKREATKYEKKIFKKVLNKDIDFLYDVNKDGCDNCHHGYKGRIAVQEVLELDEDLRSCLNDENLTKDDLRKKVYSSGVITLLQDGLTKVLDGTTTFEEIYRIIEIDSDSNEDYSAELALAAKEMFKEKKQQETKEKTNTEVVSTAKSIIETNNKSNENSISIVNDIPKQETENTIKSNTIINTIPIKNNNPQIVAPTVITSTVESILNQEKETKNEKEPQLIVPTNVPVFIDNNIPKNNNSIKMIDSSQFNQSQSNISNNQISSLEKIETTPPLPQNTILTPNIDLPLLNNKNS